MLFVENQGMQTPDEKPITAPVELEAKLLQETEHDGHHVGTFITNGSKKRGGLDR